MGGKDGAKHSKKKPLHEYPEMAISTKVYTHMGMDSLRLHALHALDESVVLSCAANTVLFVNLNTGNINSMQGPEFGGIGAVCVHPSRQYFVVCEKRPENPNCIVYEYPSKKVRSVLRNGAERGYSTARFNHNGSLLATVAIEPDFVITIWAWETESIVLRNKAFGADVYNVAFNPFNDGLMVTGGSGHIKFWSMANTFTGLKLQGHIGKFGRTEISDISAFISMPDGKVVSGSESGMLLLWEGNLIKCELGRAMPDNEETPVVKCHDGVISVVELVENNRIVLTGGDDGYFRYWSLESIDASENSGVDQATPIRMLHETKVGNGVAIRSITRSVDGLSWIVQDGNGAIRKSPYMTYDAVMHAANNPGAMQDHAEREALLRFHSGGIHALAASPVDHTCVTGGADHTVRLMDYINKTELFNVRFNAAVTSLQFLDVPGPNEHRLILAGFRDGTIRILRRARNTFEVLAQHRPHDTEIIALAVDDKCEMLWTVAKNKQAFFFKIIKGATDLAPVGFCVLPEVPTCAEFGQHRDRVYVGFSTGNIIALNHPDESKIDHDVSYQFTPTWEGVGYRQKRLPPKKDKKKATGDEQQVEVSSSDDDLMEEQDLGPWGVTFIKRLPTGSMLVGIKSSELCYEYKFSRTYPDNAMCAPPPPNGIEREDRVEEPGNNLAFRNTRILGATVSHSKKRLVLRTERSNVILRSFPKVLDCTHSTQLHDALDQKLSSAVVSYDDRLLLTAGEDGMLFAHEMDGVEPPTTVDAAVQDNFPVAALPKIGAVSNCIQRQKEIDDQTHAEELAMGKKHHILKKIHAVHAEFNKLLDENDAEVGGRKVPRHDIILDPQVIDLLSVKKDEAVAEAHLEYQWVSAKKATLMKKLKAAYVDSLKWERFQLRGFANGITLTSFRAAHMSEQQKKNLEMVNQLLKGEEEAAKEVDAASDATVKGTPSVAPGAASPSMPSSPNMRDPAYETHADPEAKNKSTLNKSAASSAVKSQLEKAEERKRERIERSRGMKELEERNPRLHPDDPAAKAAILRAERHMGDRVLKTSPDFKLPENQQPTAHRKAIQLILLESSINELRCKFNERILGMRNVKRDLCEAINADRRRMQEISAILKMDVDTSLYALASEEQPEKRFDIDREGLEKFGIEAEKLRKRQEALERAKKGFGADLATMEEDEEAPSDAAGTAGRGRRASVTNTTSHTSGAPLGPKEKFELDLKARQDALRKSDVEEEEALMQKEALLFERARLERRIKKSVQTFDESLDDLYHEKLKLESDLCMADMRVLLLFREYQLLLEFKREDEQLAKRKTQKQKEHQEKRTLLQQESNALAQKEAEMSNCDSHMNELRIEFENIIADLPRGALAELDVIYNKKIKRRVDDDDDDDDDESSDDDEEDEEEDFAEEGDDQCPHGIDEQTFATVLSLRSRRLDQFYAKQNLEKEKKTLTERVKQLTKEEHDSKDQFDGVVKAIDEFQKKKQKILNKLETVVVLKLSQVRCLDDNNKIPAEYTDDYVVFTQGGMEELQQRIVELDHERQQLGADSRQLDQEISKLTRRRGKRFAEYTEWDSKVYEVQLLKFGQRVNLEMLENIAVDRETEELKAALKAEEIRWERELLKQGERLQQLKLQQQQRIAENTAALKDLGSFRAEQRDLEDALKNSAAKIVAKMTGGSKVATAADRAHLKDLVVAQQQEIDGLKNEIAMLRRKGGHVYTPVVAKVAPAPPASA